MAELSVAERMPSGIKIVLVVVWLQAVVNILALRAMMKTADNYDQQGLGAEHHTGLLRILGFVSLAVGLVLLVCAVLATRRFAWIPPTIIIVQVSTMLISLFGLLNGNIVKALVGLVISGITIRLFASAESKSWFNR